MVELAVVVLAHADPTHVRRLVSALAGLPIYLHCDAKTPRADAAQMQGHGRDVTALDRLEHGSPAGRWCGRSSRGSGLRWTPRVPVTSPC